jgi:transposase/IS5 family transposase
MRGDDQKQGSMFSYVGLEARVPVDHPLRAVSTMVDEILTSLSSEFAGLYSHTGRPSIAPEKLLRALLLQILYSIRSERMLIEQLDYNLLFRWFVGLGIDDEVWVPTVFTKNRDRLIEGYIVEQFFSAVVGLARRKKLISNDHFTVDGTILEAWAGQKSFKKKRRNNDDDDAGAGSGKGDEDPSNPTVNFHKESRSNDTHRSTTDHHARLYKKSKGSEAKLCFLGHLLMENRNGLAVDACVTQATGTAEREAATSMSKQTISSDGRRATLGGDKGYDVAAFADELRELNITPHVAQRAKGTGIDKRTTRHAGYEVSMKKRKRIEEIYGWLKTVGLIRKLKFRGLVKAGWIFIFATAVYNLVRIRNLTAEAA